MLGNSLEFTHTHKILFKLKPPSLKKGHDFKFAISGVPFDLEVRVLTPKILTRG